jgi:hypothetical protein
VFFIQATTRVVVTFQAFELESRSAVLYMQSCDMSGYCDDVLPSDMGMMTTTQEIALLTGLAPAAPVNQVQKLLRDAGNPTGTLWPDAGPWTAHSGNMRMTFSPKSAAVYSGFNGTWTAAYACKCTAGFGARSGGVTVSCVLLESTRAS